MQKTSIQGNYSLLQTVYILFVEVDGLSMLYTYVNRAGRGQCILVVVDMIIAIFKVWIFQNSVYVEAQIHVPTRLLCVVGTKPKF
jgi:hypothetical protein